MLCLRAQSIKAYREVSENNCLVFRHEARLSTERDLVKVVDCVLYNLFSGLFFFFTQSHKMAWPFLEPVNADEVPEYYDVISDPIGKAIH